MKPKKTGFTFEEEADLNQLMFSSSWKTLLNLLVGLQTGFERTLIQYPLSEGAEKLLLEKARVEGSQRLIAELKKFKDLRQKQEASLRPKAE